MKSEPKVSRPVASAELLNDAAFPDTETIDIMDRGAPNWARYLTYVFSIGSALCLMAMLLVVVFLQSLVAQKGETVAAPLLLAMAAVPAFGALLLEYAHNRALAGLRYARAQSARVGRLAVAVFMLALMTVSHPLLGIAVIVTCGIALAFLFILERLLRREPSWDFRKEEAVGILAGRDELGREMASSIPSRHALTNAVLRIARWSSLVGGVSVASWLAASEIVSLAAVSVVGMISFWCTEQILAVAVDRFTSVSLTPNDAKILSTRDPDVLDDGLTGLTVSNLNVSNGSSVNLLSDVGLSVRPGEMIGIVGGASAGKSLLMRAIADPFSLPDMTLSGNLRLNGDDVWARSTARQTLPIAYLPSVPLMLPASGLDNLTCFNSPNLAERGKRCLEQLVFSADAVDRIVAAPDARHLSASDQKALSLARAFLVGPSLYLLDRPEDLVSDKLMAALADRVLMEKRAGRSFIVTTDNRALQEACDKLLLLRDGRVTDFGPADEIRGRLSAGWNRFVGARQLETEDTLDTWVRSHFKRDGDEANRRKVCRIAAELLAFSCHDLPPLSSERICIDFKHFMGHCVLKLTDKGVLLTTGQIRRAKRDARGGAEDARISPLAHVFRHAKSVGQDSVEGKRVLSVKIATYDPRKGETSVPETGARQGAQNG